MVIMNSESNRAAVLRLDGDAAQSFLDVVQNVEFPRAIWYHANSSLVPDA